MCIRDSLYPRSILLTPALIIGPSPLPLFLPNFWKDQSSRTTSIPPSCILTTALFQDQLAFRPTGSIKATLIYLLHTLTELLQTQDYVHVIALDFSKAFDIVRHHSLDSKLARTSLCRTKKSPQLVSQQPLWPAAQDKT